MKVNEEQPVPIQFINRNIRPKTGENKNPLPIFQFGDFVFLCLAFNSLRVAMEKRGF